MIQSNQNVNFSPLSSSLPVELGALSQPYEQIKKLDSDLVHLWSQCISDQGKIVNKDILNDIKVVERDLYDNIKELKFLVDAILSDDATEESSKELVLHMIHHEIAYMDSLQAALRAQREEVLNPSLDSPDEPINFDNPKGELDKINTMKNEDRKETVFRKMIEHQFDRGWVLGDGNCLFRSIIRETHKHLYSTHFDGTLQRNDEIEGEAALELREKVVDYMQDNPGDFMDFCTKHPVTGKETPFDLYLASMKTSGVFADNPELRALAALHCKAIFVYKMDCVEVEDNKLVPVPECRFGEEFKENGIIHLYLAHEHYTPLKEREL